MPEDFFEYDVWDQDDNYLFDISIPKENRDRYEEYCETNPDGYLVGNKAIEKYLGVDTLKVIKTIQRTKRIDKVYAMQRFPVPSR